MTRIYQVRFEKQFDNDDDTWDRDNVSVVAADGEIAIAKAKKAALSEKGSYEDENGKTVKWKITGFRLTGLEFVAEADL